MTTLRQTIASARRIVVKLGTSSLVNASGKLDPAKIDRIVDAIEHRIARGSEVVVVSSGAIAAGMGPLGLKARPRDLATKQAAASVGQIHLAQVWGASFARYGRTIGQVLLTQSDAGSRERARNAQRTIDRLRQMGAVPIVNENDTVATSEMRFGDNDRLSAIVATLISADALVLLSDVDALYDRNPAEPGAKRIDEVRTGNDLTDVQAGDGGVFGTGGMAAKVSAARLAAMHASPAEARELTALAQRLVELTDQASGNSEEFLEADARFHSLLLLASRNEMFIQLTHPIIGVLIGRSEYGIMPDDPEREIMQIHVELAEAVANGEPDRAEDASRRLLRGVNEFMEI